MNRINVRLDALRAEGRTALIPYVTAGDPDQSITVPLMHAMVEAGADIIELGVPFSDPMADGPVIQRASERALSAGTRLRDVLDMVTSFRKQDADTPVVFMGYLNPVEVMGYVAFANAAASAGVDGVLTVDLPPEEAVDLVTALDAQDIAPIFLLAPTSGSERIKIISAAARGFIYYVSLKGVTGSSSLDVDGVEQKVKEIRSHTDLPVGVGFGIKDAQTAASVARFSDAVIVGSALVNRIEEFADDPDRLQESVTGLLAEMRGALDKQTT